MTDEEDVLAGLRGVPEPPPISHELEVQLDRLAPVSTRRPVLHLALALGLASVYAPAVVFLLTTRADLDELPIGWRVGVAVGWSIAFAVATYLALVPARGSVTPRWRHAMFATLASSTGFVVVGLAIHPSGPSSYDYGWEHFTAGHACLELGFATALVPLFVGVWMLRRTMPIRSRWIAATLGAGSGCVGGLVLHLFCRIADGPHIGLIHGGVVGMTAIFAALIGPRIIDTR